MRKNGQMMPLVNLHIDLSALKSYINQRPFAANVGENGRVLQADGLTRIQRHRDLHAWRR
jgi:hypothetical protein